MEGQHKAHLKKSDFVASIGDIAHRLDKLGNRLLNSDKTPESLRKDQVASIAEAVKNLANNLRKQTDLLQRTELKG